MRRKAMTLLVLAALALPVVTLAAMIGQQEWLLHRVTLLSVAVRGADPRDLLRGHYLTAALAWDWEALPQVAADGRLPAGTLCVVAIDPERRPRVRFLPDTTGEAPRPGCRLRIPGALRGSDGFLPQSLEAANGALRLFVPETRAAELERLVRERPGALTVDLAVRPDGHVALQALRVDGERLGR